MREAALTITLTVDPVTTFSPVYVAIDFADRVFCIVNIGLVAVVETTGTVGVVEATGTVDVVTDTVGVVEATGKVDVVTMGQIPPVFTTVSF